MKLALLNTFKIIRKRLFYLCYLTEEKIKDRALILFIEKGYAGTSLADIGNEVGIKKQSIYTHFKSKDDLFLQIMNEVISEEILSINEFFTKAGEQDLFIVMYEFILRFRERFLHETGNLKFLLRSMFVPPTHLQRDVIEKVYSYYGELEKHVSAMFTKNENSLGVEASKASAAFLNMIDGLLVELIYVSVDSFNKRLQASWEIYQKAVKGN